MTPFHGPFDDHMRGFFKVQIPWRGSLFAEKALLRLRGECFRPDDLAERYRDVGLNLMTVGELFRYIGRCGAVCREELLRPPLPPVQATPAVLPAVLDPDPHPEGAGLLHLQCIFDPAEA